MCTRIDKALTEEEDEPLPVFASEELPESSDNSDIEEDTDDDPDTESDITNCDREHSRCLQYSTKIHERVFDKLVAEEFLTGKHDECPLFHAVCAYAAEQIGQLEDENPFVRDFLRFERCLAETIVQNLNDHIKDALEELIMKQTMLVETMFQFKFSHARKAIAAQRQLQFIIKIEEKVYQEMKEMTAGNRLSQLHDMIKEVKDSCLQTLPQKAGKESVFVDEGETIAKTQDLQVADKIRDFVCHKFNERFCKRVRGRIRVLNVTETVERCVRSMQDQVKDDLQAVRIVSNVIQAAYRPVTNVDSLNVKRGLPWKLILKDFFNKLFTRKDPKAKYTKEWKATVALDFLKSFDPMQLAKAYSVDVEETLKKAHKEFKSSIVELEAATQEIVEEAQGQQRQIRISDGYELAAVYLKSKSFLGILQHGVPEKGDVIGKGPRSTVHRCKGGSWGSGADVVFKDRKPWPPVSREAWPAYLYFAM